ncbi:hypothetical protein WA016_04942 [Myxococcus stipitatus]
MSPPVNPDASKAAPEKRAELDDAPPVLGSWRNIYLFVVGAFVLFVSLTWTLTWVYS